MCVSKQVSRLYLAFQRGFAGGNLQSTNTPGPQISSWEALRFIAVNICTSAHIQIYTVLKQASSTWAGITFCYDQNSLLWNKPPWSVFWSQRSAFQDQTKSTVQDPMLTLGGKCWGSKALDQHQTNSLVCEGPSSVVSIYVLTSHL